MQVADRIPGPRMLSCCSLVSVKLLFRCRTLSMRNSQSYATYRMFDRFVMDNRQIHPLRFGDYCQARRECNWLPRGIGLV